MGGSCRAGSGAHQFPPPAKRGTIFLDESFVLCMPPGPRRCWAENGGLYEYLKHKQHTKLCVTLDIKIFHIGVFAVSKMLCVEPLRQ